MLRYIRLKNMTVRVYTTLKYNIEYGYYFLKLGVYFTFFFLV